MDVEIAKRDVHTGTWMDQRMVLFGHAGKLRCNETFVTEEIYKYR